MRKQGKFFNSKWERNMVCIVLSLITVFAFVGVCNNYDIIKTKNTANNLETAIMNDFGEAEEYKFTSSYEKLSEDEFKINKDENTIEFDEELGDGIFCISDNPEKPNSDDEWQIASKGKSSELSYLSDNAGEMKREHVYYMAGVVSNMTSYNSAATVFTIESAAELNTFREKVNSGITFEGKTVYLLSNISLSASSSFTRK